MFDQSVEDLRHLEDEHGKVHLPEDDLYSKHILTGHELLALPTEADNYLIDQLLWEHQIIFLISKEKVGKSILSLQMACALSCGESFLEEFAVVRPVKVLFIQAEGSRHETINRLQRMTDERKGVPWDAENFFHMFPSALALDTDEGYNDLIEKIKSAEFIPEVIIIDPLYMAMSGDLKDNRRARIFCKNMRKLQELYGCSVVIQHHEHRPIKDPKTGRYINEDDNSIFGSFVWKAFASHVIRIQERRDKTRILTCHTQRSGGVIPEIILELQTGTPLMFATINKHDHRAEQVYRMMEIENMPMTYDDIELKTGLSRNVIGKSIGKLKQDKRIYQVNPHRRPAKYKIK